MPEPLSTRLKHAWNAFRNRDPTETSEPSSIGPGTSIRPDRPFLRLTNEKSIIIAVYNRIALDVAAATIQHVRLDENDKFESPIDSGLNYILTQEANIDQTHKALIQDIVMSMFDEGCVAVVPIETTLDPKTSGSFDIHSIRTGEIIQWFPRHVRVRVYNDLTGKKE